MSYYQPRGPMHKVAMATLGDYRTTKRLSQFTGYISS